MGGESRDNPRSLPPPVWLEENRFGVPVLDLQPAIGHMVSTTQDPACAARAVSWGRASVGLDLDDATARAAPPIACDLRYPAARLLPDGLLFTPGRMEEKWVLVRRGETILCARSWTGAVQVVAFTRRDGAQLIVHELRIADDAGLDAFGDPVTVFDWLLRTHALGELLPLPMTEASTALLESTPLAGFSLFGSKLVCGARSWVPPPPSRPLRSDGALLQAVRGGDVPRARSLVGDGEPIDAPTTCLGYTALMVALVRRDLPMIRALLELGADANARDDRGNFPVGIGIVHSAPLEALEALVASGAELHAVNADGFGTLHAAAETGHAQYVPWLLERRVALEARTKRGHTPLHVACGLGRVEAVKALLAAGADAMAGSPNGDALDIARAEKMPEVVAILEAR